MILTTECQNIIDILKKINFGAEYKNNAKRFFSVDEDFSNADLKTMNDDVMESYVKKVIYTLGLTAKGYSDFRTIIKGTLKYAKRKKYTAYSIASFFLDFVPGKNAFSYSGCYFEVPCGNSRKTYTGHCFQ